MPKVSVVIPCFNQGDYIEETIDSVLSQTWEDYEVIIVNDGSTDEKTNALLDGLVKPRTRVVNTRHAGLAAARNHGISLATGEYILPLDADDKIGAEYLEEAVKVLDRNPDIGIVYCEARYFGEKDGLWHLPEFSKDLILGNNIIFASAFFRKRDWERVGGYNVNMVYGWEDWDFWLSLIEADFKVYRIPRVLFYYRVKKKSMISGMNEEQAFFMRLTACLNHKTLYGNAAEINILLKIAHLYVDTGLGFREFQTLSQVVTGTERRIEFDLSGFEQLDEVRFDPVNDHAIIKINQISCVCENDSSFQIDDFDTNAFLKKANTYFFDSKDPQIRFKLEKSTPKKLVIDLEYLVIGKAALEELIKYQKDLIDYQRIKVEEVDDRLADKDRDIDALLNRIEDQDEAIHSKDRTISELADQAEKLQSTIKQMQSSKWFRLASFVRGNFIDKPRKIFSKRKGPPSA